MQKYKSTDLYHLGIPIKEYRKMRNSGMTVDQMVEQEIERGCLESFHPSRKLPAVW